MDELDKYDFSGIKPGDTIMGLKVIAVEGYEERIPPKEGDLFKVITVHGKTFELYYGYYDDIDRQNPRCKPKEMYPNFKDEPQYTDTGIPFATAMQKPCEHFKLGISRIDDGEDNRCLYCTHYENCEELLGICKCPKRRKRGDEQ